MEARYFLELELAPEPELRDWLRGNRARLESALTGWALPVGVAVAALEDGLRRRGVDYEIYTELVPGPGDRVEDLAAALPLAGLEDAGPVTAGEFLLLRDWERHSLVASAALVERLAEVTEGLEWAGVEGAPSLRRLVGVPELPEPVSVPRVTWRSQAEDGVWAVRSDGRELLGPASLELVRRAGIAVAPTCAVDGEVLRWRRPEIAGGRVLRLLDTLDVRGRAGDPVYLGTT